ncbi:unnamed protein product [Macrosiphum euphorbiae]|uniref:Protein cueball n=1 Tax=Macrosiphum euphorbiae TaxID=13131 RepID=A0AAV0X8F1_9HEMI|nr:unnamed protein product [Macrosiphum euphorbiae]
MSFLKYTFALVSVVLATGTVRAWDLGIVTPAQIQFLTKNVVENTAADKLKSMGAIAYDPIKKDVYVSDANQKVGSIFRFKTTGETAYTIIEPIVAKQNVTVLGMVFDDRTSTLYWTTGNGLTINYVRVPENTTKVPLTGHVLFRFKTSIPQGIAIDTCRGYLYWTNCNHLNATIERSRLNGSDRQIIVHKNLFQPLGIAVDVERNLIYWSDEHEGLYYSIESSNPDGGSRRTLIHGTHHQPFSIAVDDRDIYWSDWINNAVWTMPKDSFQGGVEPLLVAKYDLINTPMGLITPTGNTTMVNSTYCAMHRSKDIAVTTTTEPTPELIPYEVLRNICKNKGVLHANGTCTCAPGFEGEYCQTGVCDGYCAYGTCTLSDAGQPTCQCSETSYGDRCDKQLCAGRCQNGGDCTMDGAGNPRCECPVGYAGDACEYKASWLNEVCTVYCQHAMSKQQQSSVCRCDEYSRQFDYSEMAMLNHSDMSPCKLSKSMVAVIAILTVFVASLGTITMVLSRKVRLLGRRPRIKKRIVVNKSITPLTCRPPQQENQQCEITIENCCNMNICETPCFEPDFRPQKIGGLLSLGKSKKEDKANLLSNTDMSSEDEKPLY